MVSAIIFAQLWGVVQLIVLTTPARTVRVRTVFAAMAVGFYLIGPVTAFLQLSWIHLAAPLFGLSPDSLRAIAAYSVDPFIEETMKLLPLALLMLLPSIRRQWSLTDCVLVAAATGSGFGLTEHLFRYAAYPHTAYGVSGGWLLWAGMSKVFIPGVFHTLSSWITNGAYHLDDPIDINWHLAWSAIGGLAVGLVVRRRGRKALLTAAALFLLIGLDHAAGNAPRIEATWLAPLAGPFHLVTVGLGLWVLAALIAAWWLDQPAQRAGMALGPLLSAEQTAASAPVGTFTAALARFPWSLPWVYGFDRERRAFHAAHATAVEGREAMYAALIARRDGLEQQLNETGMPSLRPAWMTKDALQRALRRPPVIIWLVLITPSVLFLIVGGFPQTAWLQRALTAPVMWPLVLLITVVGQARIALRVVNGIKRLPTTARLPIGDDAAVLSLQLACGIGSVALGAFTVERVLSGIGARDHLLSGAHASDAVLRATPGSIAATAGSAGTAAGPSSSGSPVGGSNGGSSPWGGMAGNTISSIGRSGGNPSPSPRIPPGVDPPAPNPNPLPPPPPLPPGDPANFPQPPPTDVPAETPTERVSPPAPNPNPLPPPPPPDPVAPDGPEPPFDSAEETPPSPEESEAEDANDQVSPNDDAAEETPPTPKPPTLQQLADQAAERQAQAEVDAAAARQAAKAASDADDSAWIKAQTDPASDPSVAAAQARAKAAAEAAAAASDKAAQGEDPLDPIKNQEAASDAKRAAIDAAQDAQDAENKVQEQNQEAADAAKAAAQQAADAAAAAEARAAAATDAANAAQSNADAAAAQAANDAARAADPAQAAADDAQKALAAAQKSENDAFFGVNNSQAYHDARAALDAARAKADAAQAAAVAAHEKSGSDNSVTSRRKP